MVYLILSTLPSGGCTWRTKLADEELFAASCMSWSIVAIIGIILLIGIVKW